MASPYECLNCRHLGRCQTTDEEKIRIRYYCVDWEAASEKMVVARNHVLQMFGNGALSAILSTDLDPT